MQQIFVAMLIGFRYICIGLPDISQWLDPIDPSIDLKTASSAIGRYETNSRQQHHVGHSYKHQLTALRAFVKGAAGRYLSQSPRHFNIQLWSQWDFRSGERRPVAACSSRSRCAGCLEVASHRVPAAGQSPMA